MNRIVASLVLLPTLAAAQNASVTVVHGIPGLPAPVEVFANGGSLFSFDFGDSRGPLSLPPDTYNLEVRLQGQTVLQASPTLAADTSYSVVAHLRETSGIALSAFVNDVSAPARGDSRVIVRHLADAPAVDVIARRWLRSTTLFENVSNGQEGQVDVPSGTYYVSLNAAGTNNRAFGPARLRLESGKIYAVHAIGDLADGSFRLFVQVLDATSNVRLVGEVNGSACGGAIALSTNAPAFGTPFQVSLSGATADGFGLFHTGRSNTRLLFFRLPLDLTRLGATDCMLYQSTEMIRPVRIDAQGNSSVDVTIPASMAATFDALHFQFSFLAPGQNPLGLQLTDYATVRRGN